MGFWRIEVQKPHFQSFLMEKSDFTSGFGSVWHLETMKDPLKYEWHIFLWCIEGIFNLGMKGYI